MTYCIQEKLTFGSLRKRLEASRQNPLVSTELASYALNVISGVNFLHSNGVSIKFSVKIVKERQTQPSDIKHIPIDVD